jgi:hypothetical protein
LKSDEAIEAVEVPVVATLNAHLRVAAIAGGVVVFAHGSDTAEFRR